MTNETTPPLTAKRIDAQKPTAERYELTDPAAPGLRLRVMPSGIKTFRWHVVTGGKARVITIGRWSLTKRDGHVTLAEARVWLERLKDAHRAGKLAEVEAELEAATRPSEEAARLAAGLTVKGLADDFMKHIERRRKRPGYVELALRLHILPALGALPIRSVTPRDCRLVVETVAENGHRNQAGKVLGLLRQMFKFAVGRSDIETNPAEPLDGAALGVEHNVCNRFLSADEIPVFWRGLDAASSSTATYGKVSPTITTGLKVLLATGVRSCELLLARWEEVDLDAGLWTIPVANQKLTTRAAKTARPWVVPLSPLALDLFHKLKELAGDSAWVMASNKSEGGALTEKVLNRAMRRMLEGEGEAKPVLEMAEPRPTPHDLRRTMRTHLGETLRVPPHIAERCLNHSLGRIVQTYDVGDYIDERRDALTRWGEYVGRLLDPSASNVVPMPKVAGAR